MVPAFDDLSSALRAKIAEFKPPEPSPASSTPDAAPASGGESASAPTSVPAPAAKPAAAAAPARPVAMPAAAPLAEDASSSEIRDRLRSLVAPMRQSSQFSPMSYRVLRVLKWDDLPGLPPTDPGTVKTKVPGPRAQLRAALENLYQASQWPQLLEASEAAFQDGSGTFWLDLQLYTSRSLEQLDPGRGVRAAGMVRDELAKLLERFGKLPQLTFADGSAFAAGETRQWIEGSVRPMDIDVGGSGSRAEDMVLTSEEIEEARALFSRQEPAEALDLLQSGLGRATHRRGAFRTRLTTAQLCLQGNRVEWAKTILEELAREIDTIRFEQWEPETAVEVYHLLALCLGRQLKAVESQEDHDEQQAAALRAALTDLQSKLFRLDLRAVARIDQALKKD
jgi:type VI secretion system protein VasJ